MQMTLKQAHKHDACYFGERPDWLIVLSRHRDSKILDESNFEAALEALGGESEYVAIERSSHWAVGWVEYLVISPEQPELVKRADELRAALESYPVLDDNDLAEREYECFCESWDSWGRKDYVGALARAVRQAFDSPLSGLGYSDDELLEAIEELDADVIDGFMQKAGELVGWQYQAEGSGVTINIKGLAEKTDLDAVLAAADDYLLEAQKTADIRKLGKYLGACPAEISMALSLGINRVTGFRQLMQGMI